MYFFVNEENLIIGKSDTQFLLNQVEFDNAFGLQFDFFDVELEVEDYNESIYAGDSETAELIAQWIEDETGHDVQINEHQYKTDRYHDFLDILWETYQ